MGYLLSTGLNGGRWFREGETRGNTFLDTFDGRVEA